jgi:methylamine---glutamate N-methyltransferase subunit C
MKIIQKHPEVDYGPLAMLIGTWTGEKGMDVAPLPENETEENPYTETITIEESGELKNAKSQTVSMLRYLQMVKRKSNGEVFHEQVGFWMWDAETKTVMHTLTIPRGLALLAGGKVTAGSEEHVEMKVESRAGDPDWGIAQSPFLRDRAKTVSFLMTVTVRGDKLSYAETTNLEIYGREFEHTDVNELTRVTAD